MPGVDYCCKYFKIIVIISKVLEIDVCYIWLFFILFWLFLVLFCNEEKNGFSKNYFAATEYYCTKCYLCNEESNCPFLWYFCKKNIFNQYQIVSFHARPVKKKNLSLNQSGKH